MAPLSLIHTDLCGPIPTTSLTGNKYLLTFIDDYSRFCFTYYIPDKASTLSLFRLFKAQVENQLDRTIKVLRSDQGGEYMSTEFHRLCAEAGIHHEFSIPNHPQQNGVAERKNRTLVEAARSMLTLANLPPSYWEEATATACYLQNRLPSSATPHNTPYTLWFGHAPTLHHLRIFGCPAYPLDKSPPSKLAPHAMKATFVGYGDRFGLKAYRLFIASQHRFLFSRSVAFLEELLLHPSTSPALNDSIPLPITTSPPPIPRAPVNAPAAIASQPSSIFALASNPRQPTSTPPHIVSASHAPPLSPLVPHAAPYSAGACSTSAPYGDGAGPTAAAPYGDGAGSTAVPYGGGAGPTAAAPSDDGAGPTAAYSPPQGAPPCHPPQEHSPCPIIPPLPPSPSPPSVLPPSASSPPFGLEDGSPSPRMRSLADIYHATSFAAVLQDEGIKDIIPDILEDDLGPTITQALASADADAWRAAILDELGALHDTHTWTLVPCPPHTNIVSCKWLLKKKLHPDGSLDRYKARVVARGFSQKAGIDYHETYSPVLGMSSFRLIVALAAKYNLPLHHIDIKTAFLHGDLHETIYMSQPPLFENPQAPHYVCKLHKPLYGLKQSPRQWYTRMHTYLTTYGWDRLWYDYNIYRWETSEGVALLGLFVDDIPLIATDEILILRTTDLLSAEFPITDKGEMTYFLGIQVVRDPNHKWIKLSQSSYVSEILIAFDMHTSSHAPTPIPLKKLAPEYYNLCTENELFDPSFAYDRFCGQIRYLITCTRLDICYTGHILSRALSKPLKIHKLAAKRTMRYLNATKNYGLTYYYEPDTPLSFTGYVDATWAGDDPQMFSTTGYVFMLAGGPISWQTKKQKSIAASSTEAEYVAAAIASREALCLFQLLAEMHVPFEAPISLYCDNQSAIALSTSPTLSSRTKHICISFHVLKELVALGFISLVYTPTNINWADFFTKAVPQDKQIASCRGLGLLP